MRAARCYFKAQRCLIPFLPSVRPGTSSLPPGFSRVARPSIGGDRAMAHERDGWQKTFYHRAMQTSLGSALRAQYDLAQPLPDRLSDLLRQLDDLDHGDGDDAPAKLPPAINRSSARP